VQLLVLLLGICAHEAAHARVAARVGDATAVTLQRGGLNPLRHLDLFGSILLPVLLIVLHGPVFGWGRPTPIYLKNLGNPRRELLHIAVAGPLANLALCALGVVALVAAVRVLGPEAGEVAALCLAREEAAAIGRPHFPIVFTLVQLSLLNGFLALFHMLPVPPLDGSYLLVRWLPERWTRGLGAVRPFGLAVATGLALFNVVTLMLFPLYLLIGMLIQF
jgi:Zn-dependent protease